MLPTEEPFRLALYKGHVNTAAILLTQFLVARYEQHTHIGLAQEVELHRYCEQLLHKGQGLSADALLEVAQQYIPA